MRRFPVRFNESGFMMFKAKDSDTLCGACNKPIDKGEDYVIVPQDAESAEKMLSREAYVGIVAHSRCSGTNPGILMQAAEEIGNRLAPQFNLDTPEGFGAFLDAVTKLLPAAFADFCKDRGITLSEKFLENWKATSVRRKAQQMKDRFPGYYQ